MSLLADVVEFGRYMSLAVDLNPELPVMRWLGRAMNLDREQHHWLVFLYMIYNGVGSMMEAFRATGGYPGPIPTRLNHLILHQDRRGLRGGNIHRHVKSYLGWIERYGSQHAFLTDGWNNDPIHNYEHFWVQSQLVWGNGRLAAFNWAEAMKDSLGYPIAAPDMRMQFCTGPRLGLLDLYELPDRTKVKDLNIYGEMLWARMARFGVLLTGWEQLETILCNFHSMRAGRFYAGKHIDLMQDEIKYATGLTDEDKALLYAARRAVLPTNYLGEVYGWDGIDKQLERRYLMTGEVIYRGENGRVMAANSPIQANYQTP